MSGNYSEDELRRNPAVNLAWVLADENREVEELCKRRMVAADLNNNRGGNNGTPERFGVAFSGGGIRSAAVNLGVIQALAKNGLLRQVHYLSGISGGGYILGWLTSWIRRSGFDAVERQLQRGADAYHNGKFHHAASLIVFLNTLHRVRQWLNNNTQKQPKEPVYRRSPEARHYRFVEPQPIRHLREYTSYLAPRMGLFSGDTVAMVSIYLRNVLLNLTMVICALAGLIALLQLLDPSVAWPFPATSTRLSIGHFSILAIALAAALSAGFFTGASLKRLAHNQRPKESAKAGIWAAGSTFVVAVCLWLLLPRAFAWGFRWAIGLAGITVGLPFMVGWFRDRTTEPETLEPVRASVTATLLGVLVAVGFVVLCLLGFEKWLNPAGKGVYINDWYVILGLPAILVLLALTSYIDLGIAGNALPDAKREWLGRLAGYYLLFAAVTALVMMGALHGYMWMHFLLIQAGKTAGRGKWLKWVLPGGWVFTVLSGLWAAHSPKTGNRADAQGIWLNRLAMIAPPVFLAGLFLLVSWAVHGIAVGGTQENMVYPSVLVIVTVVAFAISGLLMGRLDANEFSMHLFYRNRLVRAFLGASNVGDERTRDRVPSPFTGFALDDDVPLQELSTGWRAWQRASGLERAANDGPSYDGPYPIWGTALNLTSGEDLAWQRRKAASFIYSPLYCGWDLVPKNPRLVEESDDDMNCRGKQTEESGHEYECLYGYRGTGTITPDGALRRAPYTGQGPGPLVGTAMAASGAALSPNCGYHTSPAVAALLALFNVRVGWWSGNPRRQDSWNRYAPGAYYLIKELLTKADDCSRYVYISDGGHFENLGIYELVRRQVKYILACDAGADPDYNFGDLANAVEKCRRDFGVEITIDPLPIRPDEQTKRSSRHFAVGVIHYPPIQDKPVEQGVLLYVKASLTKSDPADVLGQRVGQSKFPHDTTLKQFFNETQFEAYRALGESMIAGIWNEFIAKPKPTEIYEEMLEPELKEQMEAEIEAAKLTDAFTRLEKKYATQKA